jgi:mannitol 2-dehydrogenase
MTHLDEDFLHTAERVDIALPSYDRTDLVAGIVHIGVGNFHRSHQAMAVDRLLQAGLARDFAICGVGLLPSDSRMRDAMHAQDGLFVLEERHPDGQRRARVIGSVVDYLFAPDDPGAVLDRLADPATRIVSLTITEGGYRVDLKTREFDGSGEDVQHDLDNPDAPRTVFGLVVEALRRRRIAGTSPFTVMSCDNLPGNGEVARAAIAAFARLRDPALAAWIVDSVAFPNSMVDRITPATTDSDRATVSRDWGIEDDWPVACEPFFQWVLEDDFTAGRPPFQRAGVQLVEDVMPFELMKLRLLNVSHQAIAYFGYLAGYRLVDEAMSDACLRDFVRAYLEEAIPTLPPVPGIDLSKYCDTLIDRFSNPAIRDTLARLCADSSNRIPQWLVPVIRENLAAGRQVRIAAAICASWARYAEGVDEQGDPIDLVDPRATERTAAARLEHIRRGAFLENRELFGDLKDHPRFRQAYLAALDGLKERGARATYTALAAATSAGEE